MPVRRCLFAVLVMLALAGPASAQRAWVEAKGPNVTVVSDAGAKRARDIAWQFEQVREAMSRIFPWVRTRSPRPLVVFAARNEATMRLLAPGYFERPSDVVTVGVTGSGYDRAYVALRADALLEDREGTNPYSTVYWAFAAGALRDTSRAWPEWLLRGMSSIIANTLVRNEEIQLGRIVDSYLRRLRSRPRLSLTEVVSLVSGDDSRFKQDDLMLSHDAHEWAFVHFLLWANQGAHQEALDSYIKGLMRGADPVKSLTATLGDVEKFELAFNVYINRDIFPFTKFGTAAKLAREGFPTRDVSPAEILTLRAAFHVATDRPAEAKSALAELRTIEAGAGAEVEGLIAEREGRRDDERAAFERALPQPLTSWYAPYRLAGLQSGQGDEGLRRMKGWLEQATTRNPNADHAWSYLAETLSALSDDAGARAALARALDLMPASSDHRLVAARVYQRLDAPKEALQAAGLARALAISPDETSAAQRMLAELAKASAEAESAKAEAASAASAVPEPSGASVEPAENALNLGVPPVATRVAPAPGARATGGGVGMLINDCYVDNATCRAALPRVAGDCNEPASSSGGPACRAAGYILDVGLGMPANPVGASQYYLKGCERKDELSCVRLASLRSLGRGMARDPKAALAVLEPSCGRGVQEACYRLGLHLSATGVAADRAKAREVLSASCKADFPESCAALKKLPPAQ